MFAAVCGGSPSAAGRRFRQPTVVRVGLSAVVALLLVAWCNTAPAQAAVSDLRISEVYGGGGNAGAMYNQDFIELYNAGPVAVPLSGLSVQYASASGTSYQGAALTGTIPAGGYYVISVGQPGPSGAHVPSDQSTISISNMSSTSGKVALVQGMAPIVCDATAPACGDVDIIDYIGYGTANVYEGSGSAPSGSSFLSVQRKGGGCQDTNDNAADFEALAPAPRAVAPSCGPADSDHDGIGDDADNCPADANPDQLDTDADDVGNACDGDDDGDGISDATDNAPLNPNPGQEDLDNDGIGDVIDTVVLPRTTEECKNNGWKAYYNETARFRNQGACVSFVATGTKNQPAS